MTAMSSWIEPAARARAIEALRQRIAAAPDDIAARFERACLVAGGGEIDAARAEYLALLALRPDHAGALNNLGTLLLQDGHRRAARLTYAEAVKHQPDDPMGRVNLANVLQAMGDAAAAAEQFRAALALDPALREAHRGLAQLFSAAGDEILAEQHRARAFRGRPVTLLPYQGRNAPLPILVLVSAQDGNLAYETLIDAQRCALAVLAAEFFEATTVLPPHRLILNAIGEADLCAPALRQAAAVTRLGTAPVINRPEAVQATGRRGNAERLSRLAGVKAPRVLELERAAITVERLADAGLSFPLLLRSPGFHMGRNFTLVPDRAGLAAAVEALPGAKLLAIEFLDARGCDGKTRKYRVMIVDGALYPLHLAVSSDWKVHYFSAEMADRAEHREEEESFLTDMPGVLGQTRLAALARIRDALALDYAGIDFGLSPAGDILLFEANATMIAALPPPSPIWDYRRPAAERIRAAASAMILTRAETSRG
jgi:tetratricopeptide (TPR) repeat protein